MKLRRFLKQEKIRSLPLREPLCVESGTTVAQVIRKMQEEKRGSVLILKEGRLTGIFTERDVLMKIAPHPEKMAERVIDSVMTPDPKCLRLSDSVAQLIDLMAKGGYRHLPLVSEKGKVEGLISARGIVRTLAEHFPYEVYNLPPDPRQVNRAREGA